MCCIRFICCCWCFFACSFIHNQSIFDFAVFLVCCSFWISIWFVDLLFWFQSSVFLNQMPTICNVATSFTLQPDIDGIGAYRLHMHTVENNRKKTNGSWMMKMSATAYSVWVVIKNQFAADCCFCSQNFGYLAQVMSKLWLSKNRTQHIAKRLCVIFYWIARKKNMNNDNGSASTMWWWLVWHIFFYICDCDSPDIWIARCHPIYVCCDLYFFFSFWRFLLLCALLCVHASVPILFNTSLFFAQIKPKEYIKMCVCVFVAFVSMQISMKNIRFQTNLCIPFFLRSLCLAVLSVNVQNK